MPQSLNFTSPKTVDEMPVRSWPAPPDGKGVGRRGRSAGAVAVRGLSPE